MNKPDEHNYLRTVLLKQQAPFTQKDDAEKIFESLSAAAKFLKTGAGNVTRAIDNKGSIKGYKAKLI